MNRNEAQKEQLKLAFPLQPLADALGLQPSHAKYYLHKLGCSPIVWYGKKLWSYEAAIALARRVGHIDPQGCIQSIWTKYKM